MKRFKVTHLIDHSKPKHNETENINIVDALNQNDAIIKAYFIHTTYTEEHKYILNSQLSILSNEDLKNKLLKFDFVVTNVEQIRKSNKIKKVKEETANDTTRKIINFLTQKGCYATRVNNTGIYDSSFGGYRKSHMSLGTPDIMACVYGNYIAIETKKKDKQRDAQKATQLAIEKSGGKYYIVHSFDEFYDSIGKFI